MFKTLYRKQSMFCRKHMHVDWKLLLEIKTKFLFAEMALGVEMKVWMFMTFMYWFPGLQLILYTEVDEYIPGLALGYGMRLVLSMHNTLPPVTSEGMYISAGAETSIGLQLVAIISLYSHFASVSYLNTSFFRWSFRGTRGPLWKYPYTHHARKVFS